MKKSIKWERKVLIAKEVISVFLRQAKREIRNERISELLRGKPFLEKIEVLLKVW